MLKTAACVLCSNKLILCCCCTSHLVQTVQKVKSLSLVKNMVKTLKFLVSNYS